MDSALAVEVHNVTHVYPDGTRALHRVSLTINRGEFLALIGQNGSGKTTLAKHLNGMLKPTNRDGAVRVWTTDKGVLDTRTTNREGAVGGLDHCWFCGSPSAIW